MLSVRIGEGVEPEILRVQGCSTFEPVVQRAYTGDTRLLNRRVEVESTGVLVKEMQDANRPKAMMLEGEASVKEKEEK